MAFPPDIQPVLIFRLTIKADCEEDLLPERKKIEGFMLSGMKGAAFHANSKDPHGCLEYHLDHRYRTILIDKSHYLQYTLIRRTQKCR